MSTDPSHQEPVSAQCLRSSADAHFIIPARTRRHREKRREPLSVEESDRLVRLTLLQVLAEDVFGDPLKANLWLRERLGELGDSPPLELAQTEAGARVIEQLLARIDWGAPA